MPDGSPIAFDIETPKVDFQSHVDHALTLKLPEADAREKTLHLYANGPSARLADLEPGCDTMAINGALRLFTDQGVAPTYWIACDPQELVLSFLTEIPEDTTYLVASKCDPAVFDRLKDRNVRLWHVNDSDAPNKRRVPVAVSVTICALMLAHRLGYRTIHVWGWDCCYDGDQHHAGPGALSVSSQRISIEVMSDPPQIFASNPTWACEVNDAKGVLPVLRWCGTDVWIHGRSMIGAILTEYAA